MKMTIYSDDAYLKHAVALLSDILPGNRHLHLIDVDIFPSVQILRNYIHQQTTPLQKIIFISRNMLLSAMLNKDVDIHLQDSLVQWRICMNRFPGKEREYVLRRLDSILNMHRLTLRERLLAAELRRSNNIRVTARTMDYSIKQVQSLSMSIYRKMNLKNTSQLHFVLKNMLY